jgi:hypothetical protein
MPTKDGSARKTDGIILSNNLAASFGAILLLSIPLRVESNRPRKDVEDVRLFGIREFVKPS